VYYAEMPTRVLHVGRVGYSAYSAGCDKQLVYRSKEARRILKAAIDLVKPDLLFVCGAVTRGSGSPSTSSRSRTYYCCDHTESVLPSCAFD